MSEKNKKRTDWGRKLTDTKLVPGLGDP